MAEDREVICAKWKQKYFCEGGWTGKSANDPSGKSVDGRCSRLQRSGGFQHFPVTKSGSRASLLFFQYGITPFDQPVELLLLLGNPLGRSFFILCAGGSSSLFDQLPHIVLKYRDAVVDLR
jgi:hypothetical protein